ncbi:RNA-dependent RNA polymerase [Streptomyces phage Psst2]|nr:RNA-dependent RNA polymerase [Streptomyces phage Psst2]
MNIEEEERDALVHYGIRRKSGRYPWGSGETPHERAGTFQSMVADLRRKGLKDREIAEGFGMTTTQLRDTTTMAKNARKAGDIARALQLKERGLSNVAAAKKMGIPEPTFRTLIRPGEAEKTSIIESTADMLRAEVDKKKYIDVGAGVELHLNLSKEKLRAARKLLEDEGYKMHYIKVEQLGTGKFTTLKVLAGPGVPWKEVNDNKDQIQQIRVKTKDGGRTYDGVLPPLSISSKRVKVRYAEEGGTDADGVIYVRRGVPDVSLGKSNYAQVRIAVDGSHYLKGMAMYNDNMPPGVDLVFNTNKKNTGNKLDAMKEMKRDKNTGKVIEDDPFGAVIDDQVYRKNPDGTDMRDKNGNRIVESAMNIVNKEGNWDDWSKSLSSQMLSKQKPTLAKDQLDMTYESKKSEFDTIMSLTNETVKAHLLEKFADSTDSSAVHLKAAHLPRQATKVILPVNSMSPREIYAPTLNNGDRVALVRFPHGGLFEIPELIVNNRHAEAKKLLGNAPDAVGIHHSVAERLSGADFDGDTVLVIPNNHGKVKSRPPLEGLKGFDPQSAYPPYDGMKTMDGGTYNAKTRKTEFKEGQKPSPKTKGLEMGKISNLITDMTILGATDDELARAVRHSMVVIDAEKHKLNYKLSAEQNGIPALVKKYQPKPGNKPDGGASTIVSRATSELRVPDRTLRKAKDGGPIDPETGKLVWVQTGKEYVPGKPKMEKTTKLAEADNAHDLVSDRRKTIEVIYADHSNRLKALANDARKELVKNKGIERSPSAAKAYAKEVQSLKDKLELALENAPRERQAQVLANAIYKRKLETHPEMEEAEQKKLKSKALTEARLRLQAGKDKIEITPKEWEAIQSGAISKNVLKQILDNTDVEKVKELATPREKPAMDATMRNRAMLLLRGDKYTLAEVADQLGISVSTLKAGLSGGGQ